MMPVEFDQCNFTFSKPSSMTDEECLPLRVFKGTDTLGSPVIISCWKFSREDLEEILNTGCVYLTICGVGMPPVSLQTESPFEKLTTQSFTIIRGSGKKHGIPKWICSCGKIVKSN